MSSSSPSQGPFIGALLRLAWQRVRERIYAGVVAAGFSDLTPAQLFSILRTEGLEGLRPTEIAEQMQITKQSVKELLADLEHLGYLERRPDPADRRARLIHLTVLGRRLERVVLREAEAAEQELASALGIRRLEELRAVLTRMAGLADAWAPSRSPRARGGPRG
jgi:DNA-binding MarR family transcriptional regulator